MSYSIGDFMYEGKIQFIEDAKIITSQINGNEVGVQLLSGLSVLKDEEEESLQVDETVYFFITPTIYLETNILKTFCALHVSRKPHKLVGQHKNKPCGTKAIVGIESIGIFPEGDKDIACYIDYMLNDHNELVLVASETKLEGEMKRILAFEEHVIKPVIYPSPLNNSVNMKCYKFNRYHTEDESVWKFLD